jgi:hypothetical protein
MKKIRKAKKKALELLAKMQKKKESVQSSASYSNARPSATRPSPMAVPTAEIGIGIPNFAVPDPTTHQRSEDPVPSSSKQISGDGSKLSPQHTTLSVRFERRTSDVSARKTTSDQAASVLEEEIPPMRSRSYSIHGRGKHTRSPSSQGLTFYPPAGKTSREQNTKFTSHTRAVRTSVREHRIIPMMWPTFLYHEVESVTVDESEPAAKPSEEAGSQSSSSRDETSVILDEHPRNILFPHHESDTFPGERVIIESEMEASREQGVLSFSYHDQQILSLVVIEKPSVEASQEDSVREEQVPPARSPSPSHRDQKCVTSDESDTSLSEVTIIEQPSSETSQDDNVCEEVGSSPHDRLNTSSAFFGNWNIIEPFAEASKEDFIREQQVLPAKSPSSSHQNQTSNDSATDIEQPSTETSQDDTVCVEVVPSHASSDTSDMSLRDWTIIEPSVEASQEEGVCGEVVGPSSPTQHEWTIIDPSVEGPRQETVHDEVDLTTTFEEALREDDTDETRQSPSSC